MIDTKNITDERAARRFHQIRQLEFQVQIINGEIATCTDHLKELKVERDGLLKRIRTAARDEGELPLFNLDGD